MESLIQSINSSHVLRSLSLEHLLKFKSAYLDDQISPSATNLLSRPSRQRIVVFEYFHHFRGSIMHLNYT